MSSAHDTFRTCLRVWLKRMLIQPRGSALPIPAQGHVASIAMHPLVACRRRVQDRMRCTRAQCRITNFLSRRCRRSAGTKSSRRWPPNPPSARIFPSIALPRGRTTSRSLWAPRRRCAPSLSGLMLVRRRPTSPRYPTLSRSCKMVRSSGNSGAEWETWACRRIMFPWCMFFP